MRRYFVFFGLFTMMLINYIDRVNLSVAAHSISEYFSLSPVQMGYLFSSYLWTYVVFLIPVGFAVDRWGARWIATLALLLWSVAGILTGAAATYVLLLLSRFMLGAGESATFPIGGRVIREWSPKSERGVATAILNCGAYAGPAFGAVLVGWLIASFGWRESFYVTGGLGVAFAVAWAFLYRQPEKASWISDSEKGKIVSERDDASDETSGGKASIELRKLLRNPTVWALALVEGCAAYSLYLFLSWMPSYLEAATGVSVIKISLFTAVPYAVSAVLVLLLSWISDKAVKIVDRRVVLALCLLLAASILAAPLVHSVAMVLVLVSVSLAGVATAISLNVTLANDLLKNGSYAGVTVAFVIMGGNIFGLVAPIVTGYIVAHYAGALGYTIAFAVAGGLLVVGAVICTAFTRREIVIEDFTSAQPTPLIKPNLGASR